MTDETIWYDDAFKVTKSRHGLYISWTKDGEQHITAPTEESCVHVTRFHLKGLQEGFPPECYGKTYAETKAQDL